MQPRSDEIRVLLIPDDAPVITHEFAIDGPAAIVGRASDVAIRIGDPEVCRRNCVVGQIDGALWFCDRGSLWPSGTHTLARRGIASSQED
jgi:hypothetical protein